MSRGHVPLFVSAGRQVAAREERRGTPKSPGSVPVVCVCECVVCVCLGARVRAHTHVRVFMRAFR